MPTSLAQLIMFVSSYAPLLIVFALLDTFGTGIPTVVCVALAALSGLALALIFRIARSINPRTASFSEVRPRDSDAIAYVVTYLVPFIAIEGSSWRERAAVLIFFGLLAVLYLRSRLFYVNPLLSAAGYHLFEAELAGRSVILISHSRSIRREATLSVREISDHVFLETE
jgi:hypothetical protein